MPRTLQKLGLTPAKLAVIVGLACALAVVWGPQLLKSRRAAAPPAMVNAPSAPGLGSAAPVSPPLAPLASPATPEATTKGAPTPPRAVKVYAIEEAGAFDPFATPAWAPRPRARATQDGPADNDEAAAAEEAILARADALRKAGAAMILVSESGRAAAIGERVVQVGDLYEGFRVTAIREDGVDLAPASEEELADEAEKGSP